MSTSLVSYSEVPRSKSTLIQIIFTEGFYGSSQPLRAYAGIDLKFDHDCFSPLPF